MSTSYTLAVAAMLVISSACVPVPYTPDAAAEHSSTEIPEPDNILLTIGPRRLLESMAKEVAKREPRIVIQPELAFRDTVFPAGNWTLANLYAPDTRRRTEATGVDFLVVLGPLTSSEDASHNKYWGGIGIYHVDVGSALSALVIDLAESFAVDSLVARSDATERGAGLFYGVIVVPRTDRSVVLSMADELAIVLRNARPTGPIHIVLMAAESAEESLDPLQRR